MRAVSVSATRRAIGPSAIVEQAWATPMRSRARKRIFAERNGMRPEAMRREKLCPAEDGLALALAAAAAGGDLS
jgi:hypothetical protein